MSEDRGLLSMWTVYDHPRDYPGGYIARRWEIGRGASFPTADVLTAKNLDQLREEMAIRGLYRIARQDGDDPVVVESWI